VDDTLKASLIMQPPAVLLVVLAGVLVTSVIWFLVADHD